MIRCCETHSPAKRVFAGVSLLLLALSFAGALKADDSASSVKASAGSKGSEIVQLRQEIQQALNNIQALQRKMDAADAAESSADAKSVREQLAVEAAQVESIEKRLDAIEDAPAANVAPSGARLVAGHATETAPPATAGLTASDIYNGGFFVSTEDKSFSMYVNGLFQARYTGFKPNSNVEQFGAPSSGSNNFDVYLGRLAVSGTAFDPSWKYFLQFQVGTAGDSNGITALDWFTSKTFSKYLTLQGGRFWTPYSYEYYDNPGNYLLADLSTAEFAFALPRAIGVEASGQAGRVGYAAMISNSVRALDAGGQENFNSRVAFIGNVHVDILAPYGWVETDPNPAGAQKPELSLWVSGAYNPVSSPSAFENVDAGDKTVNATSTLGFRYKLFTLQTTGYFRQTTPQAGSPSDNSWGYGEQAGYYLVPGRFEVAERISGINWGANHYMPMPDGAAANTYFAGPDFPYHRTTEHTVGVNYYLHGHNAKVQAAYTYQNGNTFTAAKFSANRVWIQTQLMF
ncbi:MAG: hypothetical protein WBD66_01730 [Candidatus Acidiferrales bacterium]